MNRAIFSYLLIFLTISTSIEAQNSPLSNGKWSKIGATKQGIYKLTGTQLSNLGFSLPIASNQLQVFSFDLSLLSDKVPANQQMGLSENAIKVVDGGDGQINATDYVLFYNQGPVFWKFDALKNRKVPTNFSSADTVYYFLTLGQNGKRTATQDLQSNNPITKELFNQHILFEKDSISLLNSGKTLYGPPMGQGIGKQSQFEYHFTTQGMNSLSQIKAYMHLAATSYQANALFDFSLNNQTVYTTSLPPVSGMLFDDIASEKIDSFSMNAQPSLPNTSILKIGFNGMNNATSGWIDYIALNIKKPIGFWQDSTIEFSMEDEFSKGNIANCKIQNLDATAIIWNVTNTQMPQEIKWNINANGAGSFMQGMDTVANFFGVKQYAFENPFLLGPISNQNTFQYKNGVDYVIIAAPAYLNAAKRYQQFQISKFARNTIVADAKELYNDFSGGQVNAIAIRNFLKWLKNNAIQNNLTAPKYLLLLGIGNFNARKINMEYELPTYESINSNSILASFTTDDFFAALNNDDDINNYNALQPLALSVGRIPARSIQEADTTINKLINYQTNNVSGLWENKITWVADDGDYNLHLQDAEFIINHLQQKESHWDHNKIFLDFYPASSSTSGNTSPFAFNAIQQSIQEGSLLLNYTGHGNYLRLSEEAVIAQTQFVLWKNANKLPLMVTASCNFAPYDQPNLAAIAWDALMKNRYGIIGLVAANRLVFAYSNKQINDLFIQQLLVKNNTGNYNTIGEALQKAKSINWSLGGDRLNDLKFNLMGDPALQLNYSKNEVVLQKINDKIFIGHDTLLSGTKYTLQGSISKNGVIQSNYTGQLELVIYDAIKNKKTLANQSTSMVVPIAVQENILFKGKASVVNGSYKIDFILPVQVYNVASPIRVEMATIDTNQAAFIVIDSIYLKYNTTLNNRDTVGPKITAFLNNPFFKQGGWATPNSTLFIKLVDSSGIQTSGNALGHDLALWIDQDPIPIVMNNYFIADIDTYQSGKVQFALPTLSEGKHQCIIKAWDLFGNSNSDTLLFEVPSTKAFIIKNAVNYPNPFIEKTRFSLEINQAGSSDEIQLEIFDWSGKLLFFYNHLETINENRVYFDWDGKMNSGARIGPGTYFYRFSVKTKTDYSSITNTFIKL